MSGRITTAVRGCSAGAAYAAEKSVPSAAVRVRTPRSATSPERGGAGGRVSWSWHVPAFYRSAWRSAPRAAGSVPRGLAGRLRPAAEHLADDLPPRLGQPLVLRVGLRDESVEQCGIERGFDVGDPAQRLRAR